MELKLSPTKSVKVDIGGEIYSLSMPNLARALRLEKDLKSAKEGSKSNNEIVLAFIVDSGLPEEIALDLSIESVEQLVDYLMPKKK